MVKELETLLGADKCLTAPEDTACYSFDAGHDRGGCPLAVVFPESTQEVSRVMAYARANEIPVVPRGAGSGLTGGAVPATGSIILSLARMNRILELDTQNLCAVVETGVVTAELQAAAGEQGLFYPPDPASQDISTIGGNIAENAGGMRAVKYGVTKAYVMGLEVVLPDGRILNLGSKCIKDVAGYSMTELFIGSEGTLGVITKAIVKLVPRPETVRTLAACFDSMEAAGRAVPEIFKAGVIPSTLEFIDGTCLEAVKKAGLMEASREFIHEKTRAMLLVEVDGKASQVEEDAGSISNICESMGMLSLGRAHRRGDRDNLWHVRRSIHGALAFISNHWMEEDISVPPAAIPEMLASLNRLAEKEGLIIPCFGHYGDGNIHLSATGTNAPLSPSRETDIRGQIFSLAVGLGGRIAAEHGIGIAKKNFIGLNLDDDTLDFARQLKAMLDPKYLLNPGKIFPGP
ncbi:MAG: FAD-binding protein [Desulfobacter sp.]|nr:MAG: FAD-binding protein [Desulfobacter sp.]